jgi:hypothetical protein
MSAAVAAGDPTLVAAVERHLDAQTASARRLLDLVLRQGTAIRERDVEAVLARLADVKAEMATREALDDERGALIGAAAAQLGIDSAAITLAALSGLMSAAEAERVQASSAELRGLLAEIAREHGINRALMRQELAFLDHLVRLIGEPAADGGNRLMDVEA